MKTRTRRSALPAALACFLCLAALAALLILGVSLLRPSSRNALTLTRPTALVLDDAWADSLNSLSDAAAVRQAVTDALDTASAAGADTVLFSGLSGQGALFDTKELTAAPAAAMPDGFFRKLDPVAELIKQAAERGMGAGLLAVDDTGAALAPGSELPAWAADLAGTYDLLVYYLTPADPETPGAVDVYTAEGGTPLLRRDDSPSVLAAARRQQTGAGLVLGSWSQLPEEKGRMAVTLAFCAGDDESGNVTLLSSGVSGELAFSYPDPDAVVYTDTVFLMGTSDPAETLTVNGQEVTRYGTEGVWGLLVEPELGENTYTASQGGQEVSLTITRRKSSWTSAKPTSDGSRAAEEGEYVRITETLASVLSDKAVNGSIQTTAYAGGMARVADSVRFVRSNKYTYAYQLDTGDYVLAKDCELVEDADAAAFTGLTAAQEDGGDVVLTLPGSGSPIWYAEQTETGLTLRFLSASLEGDVAGSCGFAKAVSVSDWDEGQGFALTVEFDAAEPLWGYTVDYTADGMRVYLQHAPVRGSDDAPLAGVKVLLDPGHGGDDNGAMGAAGMSAPLEKDLNLALAQTAAARLEQLGATVTFTRQDDTALSLGERVEILRQEKPDFFIAVHHNSAALTSDLNQTGGTEAYYFFDSGATLAENLTAYMTGVTGRALRGSFQDYYYVTRSAVCPAVLLETGFMTVPAEYETCADETTLWAEGGAIAQAVLASMPG